MVDAGDDDILGYEDKRDIPSISTKMPKKGCLESSLNSSDFSDEGLTLEQKEKLNDTRALIIIKGYENLFRTDPRLGENAIRECLEESGGNLNLHIRSLNRRYIEFLTECYSSKEPYIQRAKKLD